MGIQNRIGSFYFPSSSATFLFVWLGLFLSKFWLKFCKIDASPPSIKGPWHRVAVTTSAQQKILSWSFSCWNLILSATTTRDSTAQAQHPIAITPLRYIRNGFMQCLLGHFQLFAEAQQMSIGQRLEMDKKRQAQLCKDIKINCLLTHSCTNHLPTFTFGEGSKVLRVLYFPCWRTHPSHSPCQHRNLCRILLQKELRFHSTFTSQMYTGKG